ncbi:MAG: diaminopimelate epimerase [Acidimicrobiales bacterium]
MGATIRMTKHHGSGNDFLVLLAPDSATTLRSQEVAALCDRRRGFGADGLIIGRPGPDGAQLNMALTNADGSFAEMSGNGIRCLVQAAVAAGLVEQGVVTVDTAAGRRQVEFEDLGSGLGRAEVDMGPARVTANLPVDRPPVSFAGAGAVSMACAVNVGNPHVVLLATGDIDLETVGPRMERAVEGGANIEVLRNIDNIEPRDDGTPCIDIEVWERGVGITESCGTGACAAATAARSWGMTSPTVDVRSGGGILQVRFANDIVMLKGPARMVGEVMVDLDVLGGLVAERSGEVVAVL